MAAATDQPTPDHGQAAALGTRASTPEAPSVSYLKQVADEKMEKGRKELQKSEEQLRRLIPVVPVNASPGAARPPRSHYDAVT
jgi:hypothetical protein